MSIIEREKPRRREPSLYETRRAFQRTALCPKPEGTFQVAGRNDLAFLAGRLGNRERRALRQLAEGIYDLIEVDTERGRHRFLVALATPLVLDVLSTFECEGDDIEPGSDDDLDIPDSEGEEVNEDGGDLDAG